MAKFKILIADNKLAYREGLRDLLSAQYDIVMAIDPEDAELKLRDQFVHLAIVDLRLREDSMEVDKSGLELCEKMSEFVPRILITAFPNQWEIVRTALHTPSNRRHPIAADLFSKLVHSSEQLRDKVRDLLAREYDIPCTRRIAVLTSGGDSPGMNMAISSITRFAMNRNVEVIGIEDGYEGLLKGRAYKLKWPYVSRTLVQRGTFLKTSRPKSFKEPEVRRAARDFLVKHHISALVVIGGDGSMRGAEALSQDFRRENLAMQTIGIPGTIDNDLFGTDMSLGAASAVNGVIEEMSSMIEIAVGLRRIFVVEVMGAKAGYLALEAAVAFGADAVLIPEKLVVATEAESNNGMGDSWEEGVNYEESKAKLDKELGQVSKHLERVFSSDKQYAFVIVAEGIHKSTEKAVEKQGGPTAQHPYLNADYVVKHLEELVLADWGGVYELDVRKQVLGYPVRGARPCRFDLWLGASLGRAAVERLLDQEKTEIMVGWDETRGIIETTFSDVVKHTNRTPAGLWAARAKWQQLWDLHKSLAHNLPQEEEVTVEFWSFADGDE